MTSRRMAAGAVLALAALLLPGCVECYDFPCPRGLGVSLSRSDTSNAVGSWHIEVASLPDGAFKGCDITIADDGTTTLDAGDCFPGTSSASYELTPSNVTVRVSATSDVGTLLVDQDFAVTYATTGRPDSCGECRSFGTVSVVIP